MLRLGRSLWLVVGLALCGCVDVPICASNPVPGLTTVAVVPFFNLSAERSADGRRFALAYFAELQKTPGFEVIPVGVVEQTIQQNQLSMESPEDVLRLAGLLKADAVAVGAVTEYAPYYPPKLALQVRWYSPRKWTFYPHPAAGLPPGPKSTVRAQSPDDQAPPLDPSAMPIEPGPPATVFPDAFGPALTPPQSWASPVAPAIEPLMAYTRFFDGADPRLTDQLRRYVSWRSDRRSGDWEAYLHRSDDFIEFCSHLMVMEMLSAHGAPIQTGSLPFWK